MIILILFIVKVLSYIESCHKSRFLLQKKNNSYYVKFLLKITPHTVTYSIIITAMLRRNMGIDTCVKQCIWNVYSCITSDLDSRAGSRIEKVHMTRIRDGFRPTLVCVCRQQGVIRIILQHTRPVTVKMLHLVTYLITAQISLWLFNF